MVTIGRFERTWTTVDPTAEKIFPVGCGSPWDLGRGINFDRHDLTDPSALDQDDSSADASSTTAAVLTTLDVGHDDGVGLEDRQGHKAGVSDLKPATRIGATPPGKVN